MGVFKVRILALAKRILQQLVRDKRTMALLIFAPILVLTMLHLVFNGDNYLPKIGFVEFPEAVTEQMDLSEVEIKTYEKGEIAKEELNARKIDAYLVFDQNSPSIILEGSDPSVNSAVIKWLQTKLTPMQGIAGGEEIDIHYLHGSSEMSSFDYFGPVLLGFFVFFFVFIIAGVSFIRERTTGTLERLLSTPIRKWEIVIGYVLGFGLFTMVQSTIIAWYAIYVLGMLMEGAFWHVLVIILFLAFTALTLGILISSFAQNELQMIQFIPIVVIPQIFFSGLFHLETISEWVS